MAYLPLISVIIPIYRVEKYISKCIESVVCQSYQRVEIILVDDGSPDQSPQICDEWAVRDERIRVIHKENGGLSSARNAGIAAARGDYLLFLDGDDYWDDPNAVECLSRRTEETKPDVLNFSYKKVYEPGDEQVPYFDNVEHMPRELTEKAQQLTYLTERGLYIASACNKLIRREVLGGEMLFREGIFSEDVEWCARLMVQARSMDFICENFYCYRQNQESISHTISPKKCQDLCESIIACIRLAESADGAVQAALYRYAAYQYGTFVINQAKTEEEQRESIRALSPYSWILRFHGKNTKLKGLFFLCKALGYRRLCQLVRWGYRVKNGK